LCDDDIRKMQEDPAQLFEQPVTLDALGSPKISNTEFYLKRPAENAWFWTYDYYITENGDVITNVPMINGRKFYWHQKTADLQSRKADKLNVTIRPLKDGVVFKGKIFFEDLSKNELDQLCYVLDTGDREALNKKKHGSKLGHAKPLGFGSVAFHIAQVLLEKVITDPDNESIVFSEQEYEERETPVFDREVQKSFEKYTDFDYVKDEQVHYPKPQKPDKEGNYPVYKWFVGNHQGYNRRSGKTVKMPNSRTQMVVAEYMEAMEPGLKKTGIPGDGKTDNRGSFYGNADRNRKKNGAYSVQDGLKEE
jgi:hypothetical protein